MKEKKRERGSRKQELGKGPCAAAVNALNEAALWFVRQRAVDSPKHGAHALPDATQPSLSLSLSLH